MLRIWMRIPPAYRVQCVAVAVAGACMCGQGFGQPNGSISPLSIIVSISFKLSAPILSWVCVPLVMLLCVSRGDIADDSL